MHTVISAFNERASAQAAMDRLEQSGFPRRDMHLEHRDAHGDGTGDAGHVNWEGMEREVAVGRNTLRNFGAFFASVLGVDNPSGHVDTYAQHVERGSYVLVVDTFEVLDAQRCNALMREMGGVDSHMADRTGEGHRSIRDIVADRQVTMTGMTGDAREQERERAMAANRIETRDKPNR
ncbi:hypothetical protein [Ramlibacter albus]|uniref:Uncharacterized protein n=1 Tax=Ramlibacter albus TaxID=2079448 RepID=A0A923MCT7_9BURK|nr:hypothetical protein [Ramlibacter albus]MBC5768330.1 hypothetical protein [Ramlibacter albus]